MTLTQEAFWQGLNATGNIMLICVNFINVIHLYKVKTSEGVSLVAYGVIAIGLTFNGLYTLYLGLMEIYLPLFAQVCFILFIMSMVKYYRKPKQEEKDLDIEENPSPTLLNFADIEFGKMPDVYGTPTGITEYDFEIKPMNIFEVYSGDEITLDILSSDDECPELR